MVSFQCEQCGDILTKKKLDAHFNRCWNTSFTCLDCMTQFYGHDYRGHTSCISEAQKYQGSLYKGDKKQKGQQGKQAPATVPSSAVPKSSKAAYVEDVPDSPNPSFVAVSTAIAAVPPPAPSPPAATEEQDAPVNVFDFLEPDSPGSSVSSASYKSSKEDNTLPHTSTRPSLLPTPTPKNPLYTYGNAPIPTTNHRYDSDLDIAMSDVHAAAPPTQTPAPRTIEPHSASQSDKKRKRGSPDDQESSAIVRSSRSKASGGDDPASRTTLHSGLTGGLNKLLADHEATQTSSPLSPKKRSKHSKDERKSKKDDAAAATAAAEEQENRLILKSRGDVAQKDGKPARRSERHGKDHPSSSKALEVAQQPNGRHGASTALTKKPPLQLNQRPEQSHSEFFLGLIDKGPESSKGQSVWGVMKMFHEGLLAGGGGASGGLEAEDKRLFRGLRMKRGKAGEIVLFARPEAELDG